MKGKKSRLLILIAVVVLVSVLIGFAVGKYVTTVSVSGKVTFTASLAENVQLLEHKAEPNADGSYTLSETETTATNEYILLPGLDIPKDPYIKITGKTPIASYLFLVVEDKLGNDSGISYDLADCWKPVEGKDGVYVYSDSTGAVAITHETEDIDKIEIIENDMVYVSQKLADTLTDVELNFSAILKEIGEGTTPAEVYNR